MNFGKLTEQMIEIGVYVYVAAGGGSKSSFYAGNFCEYRQVLITKQIAWRMELALSLRS